MSNYPFSNLVRGFSLLAVLLAVAIPVVAAAEESPAKAKKVLYIGIDGCRFDALKAAATPNLEGLRKNGSHADNTLILGERYQKNDTVSGPGWSSIYIGVWADKHNVLNNGFAKPNYGEYPHFFRRLKEARPDARTASFVTWGPIHNKIVTSADVSQSFEKPEKDYEKYDAEATAAAVKELTENNPDVVVLYLGQVDETGHKLGFHPSVKEYVAAIERCDGLVGEALKAVAARATYAKEDWLTIVTCDHGGNGKGHSGGHKNPAVLNSFLIVSGDAARKGKFEEQTYIVDAPVTALVHLGVKLDPAWKLDGVARGLK